MEIEAKLPSGEWLSPRFDMLPTKDWYGTGMYSGKINMMEARGNADVTYNGKQMGNMCYQQNVYYSEEWNNEGGNPGVDANKKCFPSPLPDSWHTYTMGMNLILGCRKNTFLKIR